jgi:aminoglycoside/choline kinase family phosphotransferase
VKHLLEDLASLGFAVRTVSPLEGDASARRFYRVTLADASTVVAARYGPGKEAAAVRDAGVHRWGLARGLPLPRLLAHGVRLVVSADLGEEDLEHALADHGPRVLSTALSALGAFQVAPWRDAPTPPFDASFFRSELAVFEEHCPTPAILSSETTSRFLDRLASRLAEHPYRLVHRDFHANNLFLAGGRAWTVDFQDLRGGPDTYDLASLLRERAGALLSADQEAAWGRRAALAFAWSAGWERRYTECAAQRGLKVMGTFLRLAAAGRPGYLRWLPAVQERTLAALRALDAPAELLARVEAGKRGEGRGES